jgi:hypothetical protein
MRTLTIALTAGQVVPLEISGLYFELLSCSYELERIDWTDADGQTVDPWLNVKEGIFGAFPYRAFVIKNGTTAQTIKILIGRGTGGNRAAPVSGSVLIATLPDDMRALASRSYTSYANVVQAGSGSNTLTLLNPAGSGRNVIVRAFQVGNTVPGAVTFQVATKYYSLTGVPAFGTSPTIGLNSAGALSVAGMSNQAIVGASYALEGFGLGAVVDTSVKKLPGVGLSPGEAFVLMTSVNAACATNLRVWWDEI